MPVRDESQDRNNERAILDDLRPAAWQNPKPADIYDLVILGAGPAGLSAAFDAAGLNAKVALIEQKMLGGNCLHTGCVPGTQRSLSSARRASSRARSCTAPCPAQRSSASASVSAS